VTSDSRLVLLSTSHRVAAGLLCAAAWDALRTGDVVGGTEQQPLRGVLDELGIAVDTLAGPPSCSTGPQPQTARWCGWWPTTATQR